MDLRIFGTQSIVIERERSRTNGDEWLDVIVRDRSGSLIELTAFADGQDLPQIEGSLMNEKRAAEAACDKLRRENGLLLARLSQAVQLANRAEADGMLNASDNVQLEELNRQLNLVLEGQQELDV